MGGGPLPGQNRPTNGKVEAMDQSGNTFSVAVSENGQFVLHLPMGTYSLTGSSPNYDGGKGKCFGSHKITVSRGQTTRPIVSCLMK